jgi:hypothetical protein
MVLRVDDCGDQRLGYLGQLHGLALLRGLEYSEHRLTVCGVHHRRAEGAVGAKGREGDGVGCSGVVEEPGTHEGQARHKTSKHDRTGGDDADKAENARHFASAYPSRP